MRNAIRPWLACVLTGLVAGAAAAQPTGTPVKNVERVPTPALNAKSVAVTVNGEPILEGAVQRALRRIPPDRHAEARGPIVNMLVENILVEQWLSQAASMKITDAEVDKKLAEMKEEMKKEKLDYATVLKEMEVTEAELKKEMMAFLRWEKYAEASANDKALQELFNSNKEMFDGSMVRVRHILLTPDSRDAKKVAEAKTTLAALKQQIEAKGAAEAAKVGGTDNLAKEKARVKGVEDNFIAEAKARSACPSKQQGGDVGWFDRAGAMVEPFAKAAFALKPYQLSDVVETQFGFHLMMLLERRPGKDVKFEDVKMSVKEVFVERLRERVVESLKARAKISVASASK